MRKRLFVLILSIIMLIGLLPMVALAVNRQLPLSGDLVSKASASPRPSDSPSIYIYKITVQDTQNGSITTSHKSAIEDTNIILTVEADKDYELETLTVLNSRNEEIQLANNDNNQYSFKMPSSNLTVKATFKSKTVNNPFTDVPDNVYYKDAVLWAVTAEITNGLTDTTFGPDYDCTRAEAVTFLWRTAGCPTPESSVMPFNDVNTSHYYYKAVLWAVENGITKGTSNTTFSPDLECTRAEIVTFLWRSQKSPVNTVFNPFTDIETGIYYYDAVLWAVENGITKGTTDTTFNPDLDCTRAEIVTFIYRCMN